MAFVTIPAAGADLTELLARVEAGEEIILARGETPVAKLVPMPPARKGKRQFGALRGQISLDPEFFDPLPESELGDWE